MVKAIARAFRWRDMLESGEYATIREIAAAEKINADLRRARAAADAAGAGYRGGDPQWATAPAIAVGRADEAVSGGFG